MIYIYYLLAALLMLMSYRSLRGGIAYLRYFRRAISRPAPTYTPFVSIVAPCRGIDQGMCENLTALLEQDFPRYEVIFVTDSESDPSVGVIRDLIDGQKFRASAKLVIAPKAVDSSQKVENIREGVLNADAESEAFVFADSDARHSETWLRYLVAPLQQQQTGASTGYRWFISDEPTFASELRSVWNASIASALGPDTASNFCWGGSMAIRRDVFERTGMLDRLKGTLSDDFTVTRAIKEAKLDIVFVPQAMAATVENCTFAQMLEFTNRQMKITRVYAQPLWILSFAGAGLFIAVMATSLTIALAYPDGKFPSLFSILTLVVVSSLGFCKAWLRLEAMKMVLGKYRAQLDRQYWTQTTLWVLSPAVFLLNSFIALISRRMTWRGIRYELKSHTKTVIIGE